MRPLSTVGVGGALEMLFALYYIVFMG